MPMHIVMAMNTKDDDDENLVFLLGEVSSWQLAPAGAPSLSTYPVVPGTTYPVRAKLGTYSYPPTQ